ncbi:MAG: hypothetical protein RJA87_2124 [Pseudomonadota bacterium]|jgi:hypothetical protein
MSIAATSSTMMQYLPVVPTRQTAQVARQAAPGPSVDGVAPPPPPRGADNRQKLQDLLSQQVDAGTISQDQATLLSDFFAKVAAKGGPNGVGPNGGGMGADEGRDGDKGPKADRPGGAEGPGAAGRRPAPPPPPAANQTMAADTSTSTPLKDALDAFLKALKDNQTKATAYGASVAVRPNSTALFVDKLV